MIKYFAPARVNLIGEHLDYNGGLVLPAALNIGVTLTYIPRSDNQIILRSTSHPFSKTISIDDALVFDEKNEWTNYPIGIIAQLKKENFDLPACELIYESNMPEASGLSSSAAVEVVTAYALLKQSNTAIDLVWLANLCKQVENEFIGVQCGIMDQYAVALGKKDNAVLLNCATLQHEYIPFELGEYRLMIMNTNKPRSLIHSKYNERRSECEQALKVIQQVHPQTKNLCQADMIWLDIITNETLKKRARHVITENLRVQESVKFLDRNDFSTFGRLMNASHTSLQYDYEVTGLELDAIVEAAQEVKHCLGARMTGAGFGGCAIAIIHQSVQVEFEKHVSEKYLKATGLNGSFYTTTVADGVRLIS